MRNTILILSFVFLLSQSTLSQNNSGRITGGLCNSLATYLPQPEFSNEAKNNVSANTIIVKLEIDEQGNVTSAKGLSMYSKLNSEAEIAALKAKFKVVRRSGIPVKFSCNIAFYLSASLNNKQNSNEIILGEPIKLPLPIYPFCNCKFGGTDSAIFVQIEIDEKGKVTSAKGISGHPVQKFASEKAAKMASFTPAFSNGKLSKAKATLVYRFDNKNYRVKNVSVKSIEVKKPLIIGHFPPATKPIFAPQPEYPEVARVVNVSGKVVIDVLVDEKGNIEEAKVVSGHLLLRVESLKAAKMTKFKPHKLSGKPVKVRHTIVYNFVP